MNASDLAIFLAILAAVGIFLFLVRRASEKQTSVRERLEKPEDEAAAARAPAGRAVEERARAEAEPEAKAKPKAKAKAKSKPKIEAEIEKPGEEPEVEPEEAPAATAVEARLREGLAKTRGGFVARLSRLFARKQIDADVLDELEQVLFSADIGPKTADRLFQSIKRRLSKE